jgi:hypothetical protein
LEKRERNELGWEESVAFFEKKEAKKLLLRRAVAELLPKPPRTKSFLLLFFKKEALSLVRKKQGCGISPTALFSAQRFKTS